VLRCMAQAYGITPEELSIRTNENVQRIFSV